LPVITRNYFHTCCGANISLDEGLSVATRSEDEFAQGYAFAAAPLKPAETIVVKVMATENSYIGSLAFGVTNCDPASIDTRDLPEDSDVLLDRPEYWVVAKDVANSPEAGDELTFTVRPDGAVEFSKNGSEPTVCMHVDLDQRLWPFWDVYGNTSKIALLGSVDLSEPLYAEASFPAVNINTSQHQPAVGQLLPPDFSTITDDPAGLPIPSECIVCLEKPVDSVIYSCGHMCMCYKCALQQWKGQGGGFCPICREDIRDVIKTFRS